MNSVRDRLYVGTMKDLFIVSRTHDWFDISPIQSIDRFIMEVSSEVHRDLQVEFSWSWWR